MKWRFYIFAVLFFITFAITKNVQASVKVGQGYFAACNTSNCTQSINLGFKPKAIFLYWTGQTSLAFSASANTGWGFAASSTPATPVQRAVATAAADAQTSSQEDRYRTESYSVVILNANGTGASLVQEATTTFTTTGFDVAWRTVTTQGAYLVHYYALGGGDIVSADAGTFNVTTGTGSLSYSSLSFQPDMLMFAWAFTEALNTQTAGAEMGLGIATSTNNQASMLYVAPDAVNTNISKRWMQTGTSTIIAASVANPPVVDALVSFTSFASNGFTVNKVDGPAAQLPVFFMAIKGGKHRENALDRPTSTGDQSTTSPAFMPRGLLMFTASSSIPEGFLSSVGALSIGSGTTTASSTAIWSEDFNVDSSDANMHATSSKIAIELDRSSTIYSLGTLKSLDATGYTLNWSKVSPTTVRWATWSIGDSAVLPVVTSDAATGVGNTSGILNASTDFYESTSRGFAWGTNSNLSGGDTSTTTENGSFGGESFSQALINLVSNTTYYYRAYSTNSIGTGYGSITNFTTGVDTTPARVIRLFQGYRIKVQKGGRILINKQ